MGSDFSGLKETNLLFNRFVKMKFQIMTTDLLDK